MTLQIKTILFRMHILGLSRANLAALSGLRENQISPMLLGRIHLDNQSFSLMYDTLRNLEELADAVKPLMLNWNDTKLVKVMLRQLADGSLIDLSHRLRYVSEQLAAARV
jgi:gamma-glutamyl phosphate reductase